ncbi:hypothetical protein DB35_10335 [Streptomyces abyssalis]|uniref:Uncharacterized protein n=1 Tax=Streptomyces abyssalis TaxID=933944 RepID=A0A1E7JI01_9ACTN|nr:hypothetical protein AN215_27565 [Streptomyces abyssalis]OEU92452.1 hypothetical protein DB35_10335 [Streptomyces abyssalis]
MLSVLVLGGCNLVAAFWLFVAFWMVPQDEHDQEALDGAGLGALFTMGFALPTLLLTILPVKLSWLRRLWFAPPAAMLVLAAVRYAYLVLAYDPW